jgi:hypothetical protein
LIFTKSPHHHINLPTYSPARVATHQLTHFVNRYEVSIAVNSVFEAGSRYCEIQSLLIILRPGNEAVDEATHKAISTAYPVYNMGDLVGWGFQ